MNWWPFDDFVKSHEIIGGRDFDFEDEVETYPSQEVVGKIFTSWICPANGLSIHCV